MDTDHLLLFSVKVAAYAIYTYTCNLIQLGHTEL